MGPMLSVQVHQIEFLITITRLSSIYEKFGKGASYLMRRARVYLFLSVNDNPLSMIILEQDYHSIRTQRIILYGRIRLSLLLRQKRSDDFMIWNLILVVGDHAKNSSLPKTRTPMISGSSGLIAQSLTIL